MRDGSSWTNANDTAPYIAPPAAVPELRAVIPAVGLSIERISPARAADLLRGNHGNRPVNDGLVRQYAEDMIAGQWDLTGDTIKIDPTGRVLDGQHRLLALVRADVPLDFAVAWNVNPSCFVKLDQGRVRRASDQLAATGERNAVLLAAALSWVRNYERLGVVMTRLKLTKAEVQDALHRHPRIRESLGIGKRAMRLMPPSLASALHYLCAQRDRALAERFWDDLVEGAGLERTDAVWLLRERLQANARGKAKLPAVEIAALTFKAWKYRRDGRICGTLRWTRDGRNAESFPTLD